LKWGNWVGKDRRLSRWLDSGRLEGVTDHKSRWSGGRDVPCPRAEGKFAGVAGGCATGSGLGVVHLAGV